MTVIIEGEGTVNIIIINISFRNSRARNIHLAIFPKLCLRSRSRSCCCQLFANCSSHFFLENMENFMRICSYVCLTIVVQTRNQVKRPTLSTFAEEPKLYSRH